MEIKGAIDISLVDWDRKVSSVLFLPHCNFRCPFCHNASLVLHPEEIESISYRQVEDHLQKQKSWIDGVCITGGEPTIHDDLPGLCAKLKKIGLLIKVDTNGTNPLMLKELIKRKLVDYISLDIKAPLTVDKYSKVIGVDAKEFLTKIEETMETLLRSRVDYEFRTTVVPTLHDKEDITEICRSITGCKRYILQKFNNDLGTKTIDPNFNELRPLNDKKMKTFLAAARKLLPSAEIR